MTSAVAALAEPPSRILLIRPSALGDVCRTVPLLASLRAAAPKATIDWLVQDSFVDAIAAHPALSAAVAFPRRRLGNWWRNPVVAVEALNWLRDLRRRRYDLVIDAQGLGRSGFLALVTGAPRRIGPSDARELGWLGYTVRHRVESTHTVDRMLALLAAASVPAVVDMRLWAPPAAVDWWRTRHSAIGAGPYAVVAPGSRWPSKRWPAMRWRELVVALRDRGVERVVMIGSPDERAHAAASMPEHTAAVTDLVGATSVGQTMAVIADAALVVANDSAPLHMAVGFDRPLVGIFGPTDPSRVGPYRRAAWVVTPPERTRRELGTVNYKDRNTSAPLMTAITVEAVLERVDAALRHAAATMTASAATSAGERES